MVEKSLNSGDWLVIGLYFFVVIVVGLISSLKNRGSVGGYFLAGRSMHWIPVGASLFASNIGSGHFIGLAGSGAMSGIGIAVFELNAIFILMILGWFFVPVYLSSGVFTMPEYLKKRFGGQRIRIYLSSLALMLYVFTKISADLYSGAIFLTEAVPELNLYLAIIILLAVSALFTIGGGLTAVMWTDFIQTIIMIFGALTLMVMGFIRVGGYMKLKHEFFSAFPDSTKATLNGSTTLYAEYMNCGIPPDNSWHLVRSYDDASLPWPGIFIGLTISSIWYWCSDQVIVQRALAAKNLSHAKAGCILAGYLKFLPLYLIVFPGMIARVLFPNKIACAVPELCQEQCQQNTCSNYAYSTLVLTIMPEGLRGLLLAVMLSALISSLTSIFNSSSTIFTMDIWRRIHPNSRDAELMVVGRLCVVVLVAVGVFWIPVVQSVSELFHYIQAITSFLAPPICAVYCLAVFWKRTNETGAFWGLMIGLLVGMIRFVWEYYYAAVPCGVASNKPDIIAKVHYLHFGILLFGIVIIATVTISLLTEPMDDEYLERLIFWNRFDKPRVVDFDLGESPKAANTAAIEESQTVEVVPTEEPQVPHIQPVLERPEPEVTCMKTAIRWICGIEKMQDTLRATQTAEEMAAKAKSYREAASWHVAAIQEDPFWERVLNINAVLLMVIAASMWIYYR